MFKDLITKMPVSQPKSPDALMKTFRNAFSQGLILTVLLATGAVGQSAHGAEEAQPNALTPERIPTLPPNERAAWQAYYDRSQAHLRSDKAALEAEVKAKGFKEPVPAP